MVVLRLRARRQPDARCKQTEFGYVNDINGYIESAEQNGRAVGVGVEFNAPLDTV